MADEQREVLLVLRTSQICEDQIQGSFTNRNHFAQLIAVGLGSLAWWIYGGIQRQRRHGSAGRHSIHKTSSGIDVLVGLKIIALGFTVFVALLSLSRGGAMAVFVAAVVCMFILHRTGLLDRRTMLAVAGAGLFVAGGLYIYGYESVANRLDDFQSIEELDNGGRLAIWQASAKGIADFPLTGTGLASFREVCPMYLRASNYHAIEYTHAENGYVQVALEGGIPGVLLALTAIGTCVCWCLALLRRGTSNRILLCLAAVAPGLAANFAHSMTDFVWYVPGCMVAVVVLAACGCRLWQMAGEHAGRVARQSSIPPGWAAAAACLALVGYFMLDNRLLALCAEPHWNRYERLSETIPDFAENCPRETLAAMAEELAAVVRLQPDNARAQLRLAAAHMKLFDFGDDSTISVLACGKSARRP